MINNKQVIQVNKQGLFCTFLEWSVLIIIIMIIADTDSLSFYFSVISYFTFVVASEHDQHTFVQKLNFAMIVSYYIKLKCVCVCNFHIYKA